MLSEVISHKHETVDCHSVSPGQLIVTTREASPVAKKIVNISSTH